MAESKKSNTTLKLLAGVTLIGGCAAYILFQTKGDPSTSSTDTAASSQPDIRSSGSSSGQANSPYDLGSSGTDTTSVARRDNDESPLSDKIENAQLTDEAPFSRAVLFQPVDWGTQSAALAVREPQTLTQKPACQSHPRAIKGSVHAAEWAETFTQSDGLSRWPSSATHVIDWNQFWQLQDKGLQVSIRWNFELPPRYTVVGYSFALSNPDGFGTSLWPEKSDLSWDEAKSFVLDWEKKTLEEGGKLATRSMSVAEKPFNPSEVSTDDIERAEYSNSRIRAAQTGKMVCNTRSNLQDLNCSCWF